MATLTERIAVLVDANTGGAVRDFNKATVASGKFSKEAEQQRVTIGRLSLSHDQLAAGLRAGVATAAATAGFALVKMVSTGVNELKQYQAGLSQLEAGLRSTGGAAGVTSSQMESLAKQIQAYSGQTDDSIVQTEALLLRFKNLRNEAGKGNDVFTQTTKLAADMAARLGGDAASQATRLGRALNDPIKGLTALTRVGVTFTDGQKATIKSLVDSGHLLDAQKIILSELTTQVGGSAKAYGQTLPGQIDRTKRAWEDASQELVTGLLPAMKTGVTLVHGLGVALSNDTVRHTAEFALALVALNKAIKIGQSINGSQLLTVLRGTAGAHAANAEAITAEGAAATRTAAQLEVLAGAEASAGRGAAIHAEMLALQGGRGAGRWGGLKSGALRGATVGGALYLGGSLAGDAVGGSAGSTISRTATYAGAGAAIGSVVPGVGTLAGAGLGAGAGLASSLGGVGTHVDRTQLTAMAQTVAGRKRLVEITQKYKDVDFAKGIVAEVNATLAATHATQRQVTAQSVNADVTARATAQYKHLNAALYANLQRQLALSGSRDALTESLHSLSDAAKTNGKEIKGNSDGALANRDSLRAAATAVLQHADDMKTQGKSGEQVNRVLLENAKRLRESARETYGNVDALDKLLERWGLLPAALRKNFSGIATVRRFAAGPVSSGGNRPAEHRGRDDRRDGLLRQIVHNTKPSRGGTRLGYA